MTRVKGGTITRARHKKALKQAKGYFGSKHKLYKTAKEQVRHSLMYAYRDRRTKKRDFRKLWITRINAACRQNDISYSRFINGLSKAGIEINRKMLSEIAIDDPKTFAGLVATAKEALSGKEIKEAPKAAAKKETVKVDKEIVSTFYDDDIIGLVFKNGNKEKPYTMRVYSTDGNLKFEKDFNIPYTTIKVSDGNILLYNSSQVCVMNSRGVEKYSGTIDGTISDFIKIGWNRYLLVLDSGVDVIKLS